MLLLSIYSMKGVFIGKLANFCEKVVNKFSNVFFAVEPCEVEPEEKCSYTLSSIFPSKEVEEEVLQILATLREEESTKKNKKDVS